jgi:hypothetical protein
VLACVAHAYDKDGLTNDFYDDGKMHELKIASVTVWGEIANPGVVDLKKLPRRSVIVKETVLRDGRDEFVGAYRYDGYSLYDILNERTLRKKNAEEFPPIIDAYVVVENASGRKAVVSWGEIYYPVQRHQVIIATRVMRIVPSKTKERWPLPKKARLVVASDLVAERNLENPTKITVCSWPCSYKVTKGMKPMVAESFSVTRDSAKLEEYRSFPIGSRPQAYRSVFYGRGRGIHGVTTFEGMPMQDVLVRHFERTAENLRTGFIGVAAKDGYRGVFTFSEICNRNDQAETLIVDQGQGTDGGRFKVFPSGDFFSDRAIKSITELRFVTVP